MLGETRVGHRQQQSFWCLPLHPHRDLYPPLTHTCPQSLRTSCILSYRSCSSTPIGQGHNTEKTHSGRITPSRERALFPQHHTGGTQGFNRSSQMCPRVSYTHSLKSPQGCHDFVRWMDAKPYTERKETTGHTSTFGKHLTFGGWIFPQLVTR